ncbi:MAG: DUF5106 domain-containing protein [bacterium]|jgi:hypothetical protein|nr:DUF5106 domain-containing protein [bacterium]MDD3624499.1 DUF5106 domain-containing protein [Proteiniphilum sp.]MDD3967737.1 DUF5106 domain-containing protein [Proteiniphilum sp.]
MKNVAFFAFLAGILLLSLLACSSSKKSRAEMKVSYEPETIVPDTFVLPRLPASLTDPNERAQYLIHHFWDRFDFSDSDLTTKPAITEQAFVDYIHLFSFLPAAESAAPMLRTLQRAEADTTMYRYFVSLTEKYFYDPNSPFRNEEYYIPVLQEVIDSPLLTETERSRYRFQLEMALKNRIGEKAHNFAFTLATGETTMLWNLDSQYLLLLFSNPGCPACESLTRHLENAPALKKALSMNGPTRTMLTVLTIYPDSDLEEWRAHLPEMPQHWLHGYDQDMHITANRLYDIKAIPTIYLLDREKRVILKDTSIEALASFFSVID